MRSFRRALLPLLSLCAACAASAKAGPSAAPLATPPPPPLVAPDPVPPSVPPLATPPPPLVAPDPVPPSAPPPASPPAKHGVRGAAEAPAVELVRALAAARDHAGRKHVALGGQYLQSAVFDFVGRKWTFEWHTPRVKGGVTFITVGESGEIDVSYSE
jgi:hypothetical protein